MAYSINQVDAFVFDFDGVLTNNQVHLDQHGTEWVSCSRSAQKAQQAGFYPIY